MLRWIRWQKAEAALPARLYRVDEFLRPALLLCLVALLVVTSSLMVVLSAYEYRTLFHRHQMVQRQQDDLQVEWGQLLLEQGTWAANNRVESLAVRKLNMVVPDQKSIEFVRHE
ncbi:MAG: cell division protein FtsL [Pontibacterium sp.]